MPGVKWGVRSDVQKHTLTVKDVKDFTGAFKPLDYSCVQKWNITRKNLEKSKKVSKHCISFGNHICRIIGCCKKFENPLVSPIT